MKKTGLEVTTVAFAVILTLFRIPLKLFFIEPVTGFYIRESMLGVFFNILFFLFAAMCFYFARKNKRDFEGKLRFGSTRTVLLSLSALGIIAVSVLRLISCSHMNFESENSVPRFLIYPALILGILSGLLILFLSASLFSGAVLKSGTQLLSLFLPAWCALISLADFLSFRYTVYSSDELMGTVFMLSSILFFLYISKSLILPDEEKKYLFPAAVSFMTGISLAVPQLTAVMLLKLPVSGPEKLQCAYIICISIIAFCFLLPPSKKLVKN